MRTTHALLLALLTCSCGTSRAWFRPAEQALTESASGFIAAQYELRDGQDRWGELRVWSTGAERRDEDGGKAPRSRSLTRTTIAFEIENTSADELELVAGETRLKEVETRARRIDELTPTEPAVPIRVAPNTVASVRFRFTFPEDTDPDDIDSFRVTWVLQSPKGKRFAQFTTFVPSYSRGYRSHYRRGYWHSPFWYPPVVFGFGFHAGRHWH
jgi:hypothetical protein